VDDDKKIKPLTERRQAFAERQAAQGKGVFAGLAPMGTGPLNRDGMPKLPVGQREVKNWPVLDLGDLPELETKDIRLELAGLCARPQTFTWDDLMAMPQVEDTSDFHCVTTWSRMNNRWRGVRFCDLAEHVGVASNAAFVFVTAYDRDPSGEAYTTNLPLEEAMKPDVLLVHTWEGAPLPAEHGGPLRMITPQLYAWKGAKWIRKIELLERDRLGFWEVRGYSATAYPWFDDRYRRR
jgi:DMSO/TMAO reductase YedYZ molybdopterin-dependent catalytic subunit